jgi:membrane-associated PAP2 superfamily phosphatase
MPQTTAHRWTLFAAMHIAAALLIMLWSMPEIHSAFRTMETQLFLALNGSVTDAPTWGTTVAFMNLRGFDIPIGLLMLLIMARGGFAVRRQEVRELMVTFIWCLLLLLVVRQFMLKPMFMALEFAGPSPSMVVDGSFSVQQYLPGWPVKFQDHRSFPGDHASVLFLWWALISIRGNRSPLWKWWPAATAIMILAQMPRLFAGAHWLSDNLIGGLTTTMVALAWGYWGPLDSIRKASVRKADQLAAWLRLTFPKLGSLALLAPALPLSNAMPTRQTSTATIASVK